MRPQIQQTKLETSKRRRERVSFQSISADLVPAETAPPQSGESKIKEENEIFSFPFLFHFILFYFILFFAFYFLLFTKWPLSF